LRDYNNAVNNQMVIAPYRQRQLDMADDVRAWLGRHNEDAVFGLFDELHERPKWYMRDGEQPVTPEELLQTNMFGYCYLDSPTTWNDATWWMHELHERGTPLTKDMLLRKGADQVSYLEQAARSGAFDKVVEVLARQGQYLQESDLLEADGKANGVLRAAVAWNQHGAAFSPDQWQGRSPSQLQRLGQALPPSAREEVGLYTLMQQLRHAQSRATEGQGR